MDLNDEDFDLYLMILVGLGYCVILVAKCQLLAGLLSTLLTSMLSTLCVVFLNYR